MRRHQAGDEATLQLLELLQATHVHEGYAACSMALDLLDRWQHEGREVVPSVRRQWRQRRERFEALEADAWTTFISSPACEQVGVPRLRDSERRQLVEALIRSPEVDAGWLCGKHLAQMPGRGYLVLFVRLKRGHEGVADQVAQRLMQLPAFAGLLRACVVGRDVSEREVQAAGATSLYQRPRR